MCFAAKIGCDNGVKAGSLFVIADHGKKMLPAIIKKSIAQPLTGKPALERMAYDVVYDETSVRARKRCCKRFIEQTEKLHVFVDSLLSIQETKRKHYSGTNFGQSWGYVVVEQLSNLWHVKWDQKKLAYGESIRPVGGRDADDADVDIEGPQEALKPDTLLPFCWHGFPKLFFDELLRVNCVRGVTDFTPGDGTFAKAVLATHGKTLYHGFCHTELRCTILREHLKEYVFQEMQKDSSPMYNALCVKDLSAKPPPEKKTGHIAKQDAAAKVEAVMTTPNAPAPSKAGPPPAARKRASAGPKSKAKKKKPSSVASGALDSEGSSSSPEDSAGSSD